MTGYGSCRVEKKIVQEVEQWTNMKNTYVIN